MSNTKSKALLSGTERSYIEVNLRNLEHNVKVLKEIMPSKCELMAVVKAEAYGHGAFEVSEHLNKMGVKAFAAATIDEAVKLRKYGVRGEILILGYTDVHMAHELKRYNLTQTLIDYDYAYALNRQGVKVKAHIKIDTGMHRLGIDYKDITGIKRVFLMKNIEVLGIFTHLCCSDSLKEEDVCYTKGQINNFYAVIGALKDSGIEIPKLHIQSSYGLLNYPDISCDYVRAGIALYGIGSLPDTEALLKPDLRPVLSLKSRVALIRSLHKGESAGYGRKFTAERESRLAVLPIGYGDGFPRALSCGVGKVVIRGYYLPIVGYVCMDQLIVDITDAEDVAVGDTATLIGGEEYNKISAPCVAEGIKSISNELLCRMGARLPVKRVY